MGGRPARELRLGHVPRQLEAAVLKPGGKEVRNDGDVEAALAKAAKKVEANYYVPHYAHASMECPAATHASSMVSHPGARAECG
jgi:CO/xanthine dehydrogenase Mo-binding subunit